MRAALVPSVTLMLLAASAQADVSWPTSGWLTSSPAAENLDPTALAEARDYALTGGGAGLIARHGRVVMEWGDTQALWETKSTTKSIGAMVLGLALDDAVVALDDSSHAHWNLVGTVPAQNGSTGWLPDITLRQLATHSAGFDKTGGFPVLEHEPGTMWDYSDGGANWLADVLTVVHAQDLHALFDTRVLAPLGIAPAQFVWRDNPYRGDTLYGVKRREFGSGVSASVDALARLGHLMLQDGTWNGTPLLPAAFVDQVGDPDASLLSLPGAEPTDFPAASSHYGLLWWNNGDGSIAGVPTDTYWSWGLGECLIVVYPTFGLVAARAGNPWQAGWSADYTVLEPFLEPIARSAATTAVEPDSWAHIKARYR